MKSSIRIAAAVAASVPLLALASGPATAASRSAGMLSQGGGSGATRIVVLRPVNAAGVTAPGWTIDRSHANESADGCAGPSPHTVSAGVYDCGASALAGDACWPTAGSSDILCLTDPFSTRLTMYRTGGPIADKPMPANPTPIALELDNGLQCRARVGGSWGRPAAHPDYFGYYSCPMRGNDFVAVWGPSGTSQGITKGVDGWTVQVGDANGPLSTHTVAAASFVGAA
ncbi:hypothetical protein FK531_09200 [Rhodococcus spelaei]|uniref:Secreted protein n=1 Tax=Rhodococcus spelaei TaxID=2546320 RepID=A0A541BMS7_9NOCA|nr:hypothetical protein [Rhodococcus spelaei]TQF73636.1 hypothetical protein FK531_09200 [Rhodococcus spelaei]